MKITLAAYYIATTMLICSATLQAWADPGVTNLAIGGIATSTRSEFGGTPDKGIDGNRDGNFGDGSVFYENADPTPGATSYFYQVDLGQNNYINRVQFLPRTDADQNVFGNFSISIYLDDGTGNPAEPPSFSQNYNSSYFGDSFATLDPGAAAPGGANGRFVRITRLDNNYWITFAEMEVIGSPTPLQYTRNNDIALNKPVTTSSAPGFGAVITAGNDGNITGDFNAGSVYHSSSHSVGEYWQVDLGANTPLSYAELFARTSVNSTTEFKVSLLDSSMNVVHSAIVDNSDVNGPTPGYDHEIDFNGATGRYIRVETTSDSYLAFSELEAFAVQLPPLAIVRNGSNGVQVSWPNTGNYTLQQNSDLSNAGGWTTSSYSITTANGTNSITITSPAGNLFFRLKQ